MSSFDRFARHRSAAGSFLSLLLVIACSGVAGAQTVKNVTINTAAVSGKAGRIVFDYVTSNPFQGAEVTITNFTATGATIGLPTTTGGFVQGDLILQNYPASYTTIDTTDVNGSIGYALNELSVNFTKFASSVTFTVQLNEYAPPAGSHPDELALSVLDANGVAWFSTADPLGANAIFTIDMTGVAGGVSNVYAPATAGANNAISLVLPPNTTGLFLNRTSLNFGATPNKGTITSAQNVFVQVPAGVSWTASSNQPYISVSPGSGTGSKNIAVSVVSSQLPATGPLSAAVTVTAAATTNSPQNIAINFVYSGTNTPFGSFDTPANNTTGVAGAFAVTGWALDNIEISNVDIWREKVGSEPVAPNGLVFIGNAVLVADARPDVQSLYNLPYNYRGGWGYLMLTTGLPNNGGSSGVGNGTYKIHAIAHNTTGVSTDLGTKTITVDNAHASRPFGTIDTPDQGASITNTNYVNFGWALTQNPFVIPLDGSTIAVNVDGQPLGHPTYNQFRSDLANLFPGLANSMGAVGYFFFDTTKFANGVHTIAWIVYDNMGRGDGLGSRFFTIANTGTSAAPEEPTADIVMTGPVTLRAGYDLERRAKPIEVTDHGWLVVDTEELGRFEIDLGAVQGNQLIDADAAQLPVGSSLKDGIFYWQLGPGFLGTYHLLFQRLDGTLIPVRVQVHPKGFHPRTDQ